MNYSEIGPFLFVVALLVLLSILQIKKLFKKKLSADEAKQAAIPEAERNVMEAERNLLRAKNTLQWRREELAYLKGKKVAA